MCGVLVYLKKDGYLPGMHRRVVRGLGIAAELGN